MNEEVMHKNVYISENAFLFLCLDLCMREPSTFCSWFGLIHTYLNLYFMQMYLYSPLAFIVPKTGKVYTLEYTEIPEAFFTQHHGQWANQIAFLYITTAQRNRGLTSLFLERSNKGNSCIRCHC